MITRREKFWYDTVSSRPTSVLQNGRGLPTLKQFFEISLKICEGEQLVLPFAGWNAVTHGQLIAAI